MHESRSGLWSRRPVSVVTVLGIALLAAALWRTGRAPAPDSRTGTLPVSASGGRTGDVPGSNSLPLGDAQEPEDNAITASSDFHAPSSQELEEMLSEPAERRLVHGLRLLRQAKRGNWDRTAAGDFAESLFYGLVRDAAGDRSRSPDKPLGLDQRSFARLGDAFGEWMAIDSEGSIAWLATRPIPLSSAVLEHVSAAAASGRDIDMAGWLDSFPAPIDLRTRAVWAYGGALIEAVGPDQAAAQLLEIPFLSPDYAAQIVTIIPGRARD